MSVYIDFLPFRKYTHTLGCLWLNAIDLDLDAQGPLFWDVSFQYLQRSVLA